MESGHSTSVTIDGITFGEDGDASHGFVTTVTQYRHPRGWVVALWVALGVACVVGAVYLVMAGHPAGLLLVPVALLALHMRGTEAEDSRQHVVTGLAARHGDDAVVLIPKARPFMGTYIDRAWLFPAGSISYATYEDGFVRIGQAGGALDVGMRHGKKIVQSVTERDRIRIHTEGDDAEADGRAVADILFSLRIAAEDVPADLDKLSGLFE